MATKCQVRSISLPSRSHPTTLKTEEELNKLSSWEATSTSTSSSICSGLSCLEQLHICLEDLLQMESTQQAISSAHQNGEFVEALLDGSVRILDVCGVTRDTILQIRERVQSLHSALRRRKGGSSLEINIEEYIKLRKKIKKDAKKLVNGLKEMDINKFGTCPSMLDLDNQVGAVIRVLRGVTLMNVSIFQSLLSFLAVPVSKKSNPSKWSLVSKLMHKGVVACEENSEKFVNEFVRVDLSLYPLCKCLGEKTQGAHERLEALEVAILGIENGLESLFRRLVKTRASLLNIISQ